MKDNPQLSKVSYIIFIQKIYNVFIIDYKPPNLMKFKTEREKLEAQIANNPNNS